MLREIIAIIGNAYNLRTVGGWVRLIGVTIFIIVGGEHQSIEAVIFTLLAITSFLFLTSCIEEFFTTKKEGTK